MCLCACPFVCLLWCLFDGLFASVLCLMVSLSVCQFVVCSASLTVRLFVCVFV